MFRVSDFDLNLTDGLLLGLLIPICVFLAYRVYRAGSGAARSGGWLLALRGAAFVLLLVVMMEPILAVTVHMQRKPLVALLIDDSESMRVEENGRARCDIALEILASEALIDLSDQARVVRYRFSDGLRPLSEAGVDSLRFDGRATDLAGALDALREQAAGEGLVAAVLVSDGVHNLGGRPERAAVDLGAPIVVVGVGDAESPKDLALVSAVIDPLGYVGRELSVSVGLKVSGIDGYQELLTVEEEGRRIVERPVTLSEGEQRVTFQVRPEQAGRHVYRISIVPQAGEHSTKNNTVIVSTQVLESRVRVLLAGGSPSPDLAYLRRRLEADPNLELEMVTVTRSGGWPYRMQALLSETEDRDLVILVDLPGAMLAGNLERKLAAFVQAGGGLLVIGGGVAFNESYARSALAGVLPLEFSGERGSYRSEPFQVEIPKAAYRHPILRISDDPLADESEWGRLPPLLAYNQTAGARPGAVVLVRHPTEMAGKAKMPLVAVMRAGQGKTMAVGFRTFWRFGLMMRGIGETDGVSQMFWKNAVRWLVTREDVARVQAVVDRPTYRSGEPVTFHARVFDELLQPQEGALVTVSVGEEGRRGVLQDEGEGRYSGQMGGFPQGDYAFRVEAVKGAVDLGKGAGHFTVGRYSLEYEEVRMNAALLGEVAARSGGAFVRPSAFSGAIQALNFAPQPVRVLSRTRLWGQRWPLFLLILLLAAEWTVRRRRGMV